MSIPLGEDKPSQPNQRLIFHDRNFTLLWLGQLISNLGDAALLIAVPMTIYDMTKTFSALSLVTIAGAIPTLLLGLFAGVFVDRWDRRRTMIVSDLGRAFAVLLMLGVHDSRQTWLFYVAIFLVAAFSCFFTPARSGLIKTLLPKEQLMQSNALMTSGMQITALVGPALGAVLLTLLQRNGVFLFDSLTYVVSSACVASIAAPQIAVPNPHGFSNVWRDMKAGLNYVASNKVLLGMMTLLGIAIIGAEISNTLEYAFVKDIWHAPSMFGYLMSAFGVGMIAAGLLVSGPLRAVEPKRLLMWAFAIFTVGGFGWAFAPNYYVGLIALAVFGLGNMLINIPLMTLFQTLTAPHMMGRVTATASVVNRVSMLAAGALTAGLSHFRLQPIFVGLAVVYLLCTFLVRPLMERKPVRAFPDEEPSETIVAADVKPARS